MYLKMYINRQMLMYVRLYIKCTLRVIFLYIQCTFLVVKSTFTFKVHWNVVFTSTFYVHQGGLSRRSSRRSKNMCVNINVLQFIRIRLFSIAFGYISSAPGAIAMPKTYHHLESWRPHLKCKRLAVHCTTSFHFVAPM